jgi:5-methylcytosine-specific restriction endonuclease McrA
MKVCTRCKKELSEESFYDDKRGGLRSQCKTCHQEASFDYQKNHVEDNRRRGREYRNRHPFRLDVQRANRRAQKYGVVSTLTELEWKIRVEQFSFICQICGRGLTLEVRKENTLSLDHKIPLNRGGDNTKENSVPTCWNCNRSKGDRTEEEFFLWIETVFRYLRKR